MATSTELEPLRPEERAVHGLELAERVFTPERRAAIAKFLNVTPEDPALVPYLAVCASYGLDPVMGQIWLIPQRVKVRDGDAESWQDRYRPSVGRDGLLAIARRDARFRGLKGTVVCEHDSFEVQYDGSEDEPKVLHRFASKPTSVAEGVNPARWRGRIVGAWAKAYVAGQPPVFYFAPIGEHYRTRERNGQVVPDGAWGYVSTMIQKAAQSYVLRIGFGITGVVPADELIDPSRADTDGPRDAIEADAVDEEFDWKLLEGSDATAVRALRAAVEHVNAVAPLSWAPAKCEMVFKGRTDDELVDLADQIEREAKAAEDAVTRREEAAAASPEPGAGEGATEEIPDADVVELTDEQRQRAGALQERRVELVAERNRHPEGSEEWTVQQEALAAVERELAAVVDPAQGELLPDG